LLILLALVKVVLYEVFGIEDLAAVETLDVFNSLAAGDESGPVVVTS